jgi:hypothetical protein
VEREPVEHPAERHLRHGDALCLGDLPGDLLRVLGVGLDASRHLVIQADGQDDFRTCCLDCDRELDAEREIGREGVVDDGVDDHVGPSLTRRHNADKLRVD